MVKRYFEDLSDGEFLDCKKLVVTREDIIEFAGKFDPQPFHIDDNASCHVIGSLPEDTIFSKKQLMYIIKQGAILCKQFSKYKSHKNVSIVYTAIKNVTMTNIPGSVNIQSSKNISI